MMKLLIGIVIVIWGIVGVLFYLNFKDDDFDYKSFRRKK